jgi:chromosome segregation ATPase
MAIGRQMAVFEQQQKLASNILDIMRERIKALREMKELPKKEMDKVKEDIAKVEEDFARYMNRTIDLETKVDKIVIKVM